ncbi:hypothetical protein SAMN05421688_0706 [Poseidonocella pacifica]|uniref:PilZ domain-containing protein n=1 Tax=Poseidonocella pacifica TaxID=871651 RepID=A0A1I0VJK0_9RHOB|nr:PilZ domain-containing protein [Poseidonocella pacifica]SFA76575.1 hypothetical protein SAMN05421688_0706 [Poseidonocella pacifica]
MRNVKHLLRGALLAAGFHLLAAPVAAQDAVPPPYCEALLRAASLADFSDRIASAETHYDLNIAYRFAVLKANAALDIAGPPPEGAPGRALLELHLRAHQDIVKTAEIMGLAPALSGISTDAFAERDAKIRAGIRALSCAPPGWREKLEWALMIFYPVERLWDVERMRPVMLWAICFGMIAWARRRTKRQENLPAITIIDGRDEGRIPCNLPAELGVGDMSVSLRVLDISRHGCRFAMARAVDLPEYAVITLPGGVQRHIRQVWQRDQTGAVRLLPRLSEEELELVMEENGLRAADPRRSADFSQAAKELLSTEKERPRVFGAAPEFR